MTPIAVTVKISPDALDACTDAQLVTAWHALQGSDVTRGDAGTGIAVAAVAGEIITRWLAAVPPVLDGHAAADYWQQALRQFATYDGGEWLPVNGGPRS